MAKQVDFYFDFGSPTAYLAWTQLPAIAMDCRADIAWKPMLLGGVFKATGNQSPVLIEPKGRWMWGDMARWARRYGVTLNALVAANPKLSPRRLMPGVKLSVPAVAPSDDPTPPAERADVQVHIVKARDNFWTIARTYNVSVNALIDANPNLNPRRLQLGQRINIPAPTEG